MSSNMILESTNLKMSHSIWWKLKNEHRVSKIDILKRDIVRDGTTTGPKVATSNYTDPKKGKIKIKNAPARKQNTWPKPRRWHHHYSESDWCCCWRVFKDVSFVQIDLTVFRMKMMKDLSTQMKLNINYMLTWSFFG